MLIREATALDAEVIQAIYAPAVTESVISFEEVAPSVAEMAARIEAYGRDYPYLVAERDGLVVGYAYGSKHRERAAYRHSADVAVYVAQAARGSGVGRALYDDLLPRMAAQGVHAAFAGITLPNAGSERLHESVGFELVGIYREVGFKFGRWLDVGWWQRRL